MSDEVEHFHILKTTIFPFNVLQSSFNYKEYDMKANDPVDYKISIEDYDKLMTDLNFWIGVAKKSATLYREKDGNQNDVAVYTKHSWYKLFDFPIFKKVLDDVCNVFYQQYSDAQLWTNAPEFENNMFVTDLTFCEKLIINNNDAKVHIIGDIHASFHSLVNILEDMNESFEGNTMTLKEGNYIIFLGDLVDYGPYCLEVLLLAFTLKVKNPKNVYIINGNHEDQSQYKRIVNNNMQAFQMEIMEQFKELKSSPDETDIIDRSLWFLPSAIMLRFNNKLYQLCHGAFDQKYGGYHTKTKTFDKSKSKLYAFLLSDKKYDIMVTATPMPNSTGMKWGDFMQSQIEEIIDKQDGRFRYNAVVTEKYLKTHGIETILSGHQDMETLCLLLPSDMPVKPDNSIQLTNATFQLCSSMPPSKYNCLYDLYAPKYLYPTMKYVTHPQVYMKNPEAAIAKPRHEIFLDPTFKKNFLALVTSTATASKVVTLENCYLTLFVATIKNTDMNKDKQDNAINGGSQDNYYFKYLKYKEKYRRLRDNN